MAGAAMCVIRKHLGQKEPKQVTRDERRAQTSLRGSAPRDSLGAASRIGRLFRRPVFMRSYSVQHLHSVWRLALLALAMLSIVLNAPAAKVRAIDYDGPTAAALESKVTFLAPAKSPEVTQCPAPAPRP